MAEEAKSHRGRETAYHILNRVLRGGAYSNLAVAAAFEKNEDLRRDERRVAVNLVCGVLRNLDLLDEVFRSKCEKKKLAVSGAALLVGRMAIYELLFNTKAPAYAASEYVTMARAMCGAPEAKFLNAVLRRVRPDDIQAAVERAETPEARIAVEFSHPEWFVRAAMNAFGADECLEMIRANNTAMPAYYRVNTNRISVEQLIDTLRAQRVEVTKSEFLETCIYFEAGHGYMPEREYQAGLLTPQDLSTQIVAHELAPAPGERILDLCCGRGTKTTHAAELMEGRGKIIACDIHAHKIELLEAEKKRLGFEAIIEGVCADAAARPPLGEFDRVLLDAPCSGTGTFRRRPELKRRATVDSLRGLGALQRGLLTAAAGYVRPGGRLLYATCSLLPEENDGVVGYFLGERGDFAVDSAATSGDKIPCSRTTFGRVFLPHHLNACSIAITVLKRKDNS